MGVPSRVSSLNRSGVKKSRAFPAKPSTVTLSCWRSISNKTLSNRPGCCFKCQIPPPTERLASRTPNFFQRSSPPCASTASVKRSLIRLPFSDFNECRQAKIRGGALDRMRDCDWRGPSGLAHFLSAACKHDGDQQNRCYLRHAAEDLAGRLHFNAGLYWHRDPPFSHSRLYTRQRAQFQLVALTSFSQSSCLQVPDLA